MRAGILSHLVVCKSPRLLHERLTGFTCPRVHQRKPESFSLCGDYVIAANTTAPRLDYLRTVANVGHISRGSSFFHKPA